MESTSIRLRCFIFLSVTYSVHCLFPFRNTSLPWSKRVDDLVSRLTPAEIILQLSKGGSGPKAGPAPAIPRLGILPYSWNTECLSGDVDAGKATSFPMSIGLVSAFHPELIFNVSQATSIEVRAKFTDYMRRKIYGTHRGISCFSPVINIMRHPLWGRNQETYGEDPYLSGVYAANFVRGLQGNHPRYIRANAGCKHFDAYAGPENIPVQRHNFSANVSERDMRLTFLPAFRACVKAGTYNIMCSYNSINGVPACADKNLLTGILRQEWGFRGYVISDQGAIENVIYTHKYLSNPVDTVAACINAGCNLELSGNLNSTAVYASMGKAIQQGKLAMATVTDTVKPLFYTRMRLGEFDPPEMNPYSNFSLDVLQSEAHQALALKAAMESFVLLKNIDQFLPLSKKMFSKIAVVGPFSIDVKTYFGDYSPDVDVDFAVSVAAGLLDLTENLDAVSGCDNPKCDKYDEESVQAAVKGADLIVVCLGTGNSVESEGNDRRDIELPGHQFQVLQDAVSHGDGAPVLLLLFNAGALNVTWADTSLNVHAIMACGLPAQTTGTAVRKVLTMDGPGSVPAGRLPDTWPKSMDQVPPMANYTMVGRTYRYFIGKPLYPFGYGLSYSIFAYAELNLTANITAGQNQNVYFKVINDGPYAADEVPQLYISWLSPSEKMPKRQLVGFDRVSLQFLQQVSMNITITPEQMAVWTDKKGFVVEPGCIQVFVGGQQPFQVKKPPSNVLTSKFCITGQKVLGKF